MKEGSKQANNSIRFLRFCCERIESYIILSLSWGYPSNCYFSEDYYAYYILILKSIHEFLTESLRCFENDSIAAAYCLLRRPCKDEYVLLDHLLKDDNFNQRLKDMTPDKLEEEIKKGPALENDDYFELMYKLIFDRAHPKSLDKTWNKAAHIVTTFKHHRSRNGELNFITLTSVEREQLRTDYYNKACIVFAGIHKIALSIFSNIFELDILVQKWLYQLIDYKLAIISEYPDFAIADFNSISSAVLRLLGEECPKCGEKISLPIFLIFNKSLSKYSFTCSHCKHRHTIGSLCNTVLTNEHERYRTYKSEGEAVRSLYSWFEAEMAIGSISVQS